MRLTSIVALTVALALGGLACAVVPVTITPDLVRLVQANLTLVIPEGEGKHPVVIFFQGTGGGNRRAEIWAAWFRTLGVASAIVDNARIRNRSGNPPGSMYTEDAAAAWELLQAHPRIDARRFALMGFSRGGQQALEAGPHFTGQRAVPTFVFALYPGGWESGKCWNTHRSPTRVHIFFGDLDDVGRDDAYTFACERLVGGRDPVAFHLLQGATHGYDDRVAYTFPFGRSRVARVTPNPEAVERTRRIIATAVGAGWGRQAEPRAP